MKKIIIPILALVYLMVTSCEKEIQVNLNSSNPRIVVEANITNLAGPYTVKLTRTVNFSDSNSFPAVNNAVVLIFDDAGNRDSLTETSPGIYQTSTLQGVEGRTYSLDISADGQHFTSSCRMPQMVRLDSISFTEDEEFGNASKIVYSILPGYTDPESVKNYYQFCIYVNQKKENLILVRTDLLTNGKANTYQLNSRDLELTQGDEVKLELRSIDESVHIYYKSLNQADRGNSSPANPISNISGGALGYFSAYSVDSKARRLE